ncbi:MAG: prepilin-type N-terminal cleavage/methylation domain-containing protein [Planctomycetota bacterium]|nr:prepilin-type N-terminal cleavage/methylation domain-containing protein [Planctomycetota bacterium]
MPARTYSQRRARGMTLLEVMIAMFIFLVGIVGVLAAIPSGIHSAEWVIFQDAAIHLAHSKFGEFRRDRVDPNADLIMGGAYMNKHGTARPGGWRDFHYKNSSDALSFDNETYKYFDDIERYEWRLEGGTQYVGASSSEQPAPPAGCLAPVAGSGTDVGLYKVTVVIRMKGTSREFRFTQYMVKYD